MASAPNRRVSKSPARKKQQIKLPIVTAPMVPVITQTNYYLQLNVEDKLGAPIYNTGQVFAKDVRLPPLPRVNDEMWFSIAARQVRTKVTSLEIGWQIDTGAEMHLSCLINLQAREI
jgi:hypothetical protein